jgi:hypothetical protein
VIVAEQRPGELEEIGIGALRVDGLSQRRKLQIEIADELLRVGDGTESMHENSYIDVWRPKFSDMDD